MKIKKILFIPLVAISFSLFAQSENVGIHTTTPGTTLDVNGGITHRETIVAIAGNVATVPANVSQVQLTGTATAVVDITAPAAPNAGQRLVIFNNTTGGFGAVLNGVTIANGKALEYVYSDSGWRSTDGGVIGADPVNMYTADGILTNSRTVTQGNHPLTFTSTVTNGFSVNGATLSVDAANDRVGIGTTTPSTKLTINTPDNTSGLKHTNGTIDLQSYIGSGAGWLGTTTNHALRFETNSTPRMYISAGGNVGIDIVTATEKEDLNGHLRIRSLPASGSVNAIYTKADGTASANPDQPFTAVKTIVADDNGVLGYITGLPTAYDGYSLTGLHSFKSSEATNRSFTYRQLVGNCTNPFSLCPTPSSTVFNPLYTFSFDAKSSGSNRYLQMNLDYLFNYTTINNMVSLKSTSTQLTLKILINNKLVKSFKSIATIVSGGNADFVGNKAIILDLAGISLKPTNNIVNIVIETNYNSLKANVGTGNGNFSMTGTLLTLSLMDLSFLLYEK